MITLEQINNSETRWSLNAEMAKEANIIWDTLYLPNFKKIFTHTSAPSLEKKYATLKNRNESISNIDFQETQTTKVEIACNPCVKLPYTDDKIDALFNRGMHRTIDSLVRQTKTCIFQTLTSANYFYFDGNNLESNWDRLLDFAEKNPIVGEFSMSELTFLPADDPGNDTIEPKKGFVAYAEITSLWCEMYQSSVK